MKCVRGGERVCVRWVIEGVGVRERDESEDKEA